MYLINGVSHYALQAARFLLEFSAREAERKIINLDEARKKLRAARRTVPIAQPVE